MPAENIVNVDGETVLRQEWLKEPVFKYQLWSPLGAHAEALACIKQGLPVPKEVLEVGNADFNHRYGTFFSLIKDWNGLDQDERDQTEGLNYKGEYYNGLAQMIAERFNGNLAVNVYLSMLNPEGNTAVDAKKELLRVAVAARLNQPNPILQSLVASFKNLSER